MYMGKVFKYGKDVDTDQIIASQYLLYPTIEEMKEHTFESLDSEFIKSVKPGDYIVADENFGCGSSREQAPAVLKACGIKAVIAKSFARIFYRNSINLGVPVIVCSDIYDHVKNGDELVLNMDEGYAEVSGVKYSCTRVPEYMKNILDQGGLLASLDK
ncbi:MAG: 3-isopropylmalate dehydratase small subunit [Lachnospiraceae bacterium]|nr:3-isopropylmalate dehydratase small subunit [Lachnospiraceae bacterium]